MKTITFILWIIISYTVAYSQNVIDPPRLDSVHLNSTEIEKNFNKFIKGWNWGSPGAALDNALGINFYHRMNPPDNSDYGHGMKITAVVASGRNQEQIFNGQGIHLEPTITVDSTPNFKPRYGDRTGSVFGFKYRNFIIGDTTSDFNRFVLRTDNYTEPVKVLDSIWDGKILRWLDYIGIYYRTDTTISCDTSIYVNEPPLPPDTLITCDTILTRMKFYTSNTDSSNIGVTNFYRMNSDTDKILYQPFNGKQWHLSVNLKALDSAAVESHLNDTILVLKMPYTLYNDIANTKTYSNVRFSRIPSRNIAFNDSIRGSIGNHYRGIARRDTASQLTEQFVITGAMLKNLSDTNRSITLSTFAEFTGKTIPIIGGYENNPLMKYDYYENRYNVHEYITEFDVEVKYRGILDVSLDWLRIETPRLEQIMRGVFDTTMQSRVHEELNKVRNNPGIASKIYRFYTNDEFLPNLWCSNRYMNMLLDTLADVEISVMDNLPGQYYHATGMKEFWNGNSVSYRTSVAIPYIRKGAFADLVTNSTQFFNYSFGYAGCSNGQAFSDTLNSNYETFLLGTCNTIPITDLNCFEESYSAYNNYTFGTLFNLEDILYDNFYKYPGLIYGKNNWWANLWVQSNGWQFNATINSFVLGNGNSRPKTGEETRIELNTAIMLGCKGLVYWKKISEGSIPGSLDLGLQCLKDSMPQNMPIGNNLIYSQLIGGDFVNLQRDPNGFNNYFSNNYNWDETGIDSNHIYIGLTSTRAEINKIHKWIDENESLLMRLKLISWRAKGFSSWSTTHPDYAINDDISKYININAIHSRPLGRVNSDGSPFYEQHNTSNIDSGFYDVTLHFETDSVGNRSNSKIFYIMCLNRRTDPLFLHGGRMNFYTTAEFDTAVVRGGIDLFGNQQTKSWWQSKWFSRQGSREIVFSLNLGSEYKNKIVRVTEIGIDYNTHRTIHCFGNDTITNSELGYLYPRVDKVIHYRGEISANYLPGESKLYKCEILDIDTTITGNLAHSNQTKLIVHPVLENGELNQNKVQYHLVYFKEDTVNGQNKRRVFYNKSLPVGVDDQNPQIKWQIPDTVRKGYMISTDLRDANNNQLSSNINCDYPSIVVRQDPSDNQIKAYIAYSCEDGSTNPTAQIFCSILNVTDTIGYPQSAISNKRIDTYRTGEGGREEWGNPVIGSVASGNYYAWSDAGQYSPPIESSIKVVFSGLSINPANSTSRLTISPPTYNELDAPQGGIDLKHPSMSVYSPNQTSICPLVFQGVYLSKFKIPPIENENEINRILYTYVKLDESNMPISYLPSNLSAINRYSSSSSNKSILRNLPYGSSTALLLEFKDEDLSLNQYLYPVVYRRILNQDIISFQNENKEIISYILKQNISGNSISFLGTSWLTDRSPSNHYSQSNISQPSGLLFNGNYEVPYGNYVLNFKYNNSIYQYLGPEDFKTFDKLNYAFRCATPDGDQSHLAQSKTNNRYSPWKNRRVFNNSQNKILATATYFYNTSPEDLTGENQIGFKADTASLFMNLPQLSGNLLPIERPVSVIYEDNDSAFVIIQMDTLFTDWFSLDTDTIEIKVTGQDTAAKFILQYEDNYILPLSIPGTLKLDTGRVIRYCFYNGYGMDFRFAFIRTDTLSGFSENTIIGGVPVLDTVFYSYNLERPIVRSVPNEKTAAKEIILEVTPIPAKDIVYVSARLPENISAIYEIKELQIKLISFDGKELLSVPSISGVTKSISLEKFAQGIYFIRAESSDLLLKESVLPAVKQIVIER